MLNTTVHSQPHVFKIPPRPRQKHIVRRERDRTIIWVTLTSWLFRSGLAGLSSGVASVAARRQYMIQLWQKLTNSQWLTDWPKVSKWKGKTMLQHQNLVYQLQQRRNRAHVQLCCRRCSKVFGTWRHNLVAEALTKALATECWRSILSLLRLPVRISWSLGKVYHPVSCHHECLNKSWQAKRNFWAASATAEI